MAGTAPSPRTTAAAEADVGHPWATVARHLPPSLVSDRAAGGLGRIARRLPATTLVALELRLGATASRAVDLSFRIDDPDEARALSLPAGPARTFLDRWADGDPELAPVFQVWLELDRPSSGGDEGDDLPEPVVCARISPDADATADALTPVAGALRGAPLPSGQRRLLARTLDAIPDGATLLYLFGLRARDSGAVRVEIAGLDAAAMARFLARLDAPARGTVESVAPLVDLAGRTHLSVEVADHPAEILPRTGVELSFQGLAGHEPGWERLLDALMDRKLATPEQRRDLFRWAGQSTFWSDSATWPAERLGLGGALARCLSHVKLVCRPDRPPKAKAYLLYQLISRRPATSP